MSFDKSEYAKRSAELDAKGKALDREHQKLDRKWKERRRAIRDLEFVGFCAGMILIVVVLPILVLVKLVAWLWE